MGKTGMAAADDSGSRPSFLNSHHAALWLFAAIFVAAAGFYFHGLGSESLGASEAYSAMAAAEPGITSIVRMPVHNDPGKQVLYYVLLHFWTDAFGMSETALRSLSVVFALAALALLFAVGREMFDSGTAAATAAVWAFNPLAFVYAQRARMYSMFIAVALAHLLTLWRVRRAPSAVGAAICGVLGAILLYTHLAGAVLIAAEVGLALRDLARGRRDFYVWLALGIAVALWVPWLPVVWSQSKALVAGHWLDWIGPVRQYSVAARLGAVTVGVAAALWLCFGGALESDPTEPLRWCATWSLLPLVAFGAGSIAIRPIFSLRYAAPSVAVLALVAMHLLGLVDRRMRNLFAAAVAGALVILSPFSRPIPQPWRTIAAMVAARGPAEPVFFESGFVTSGAALKLPNRGFPFGYYSVPFDYYCRRPNPRITVPAYDAESARETIAIEVARAGGGWLVSWKLDHDARAELPDPARFRATVTLRRDRITVYRIVPTAAAAD
jgi:4-amino-4-deoxy-L-arabinose transferase-like glycosyltransferase